MQRRTFQQFLSAAAFLSPVLGHSQTKVLLRAGDQKGGLPSTTARWTPDGWRVTGHKLYSTGAPILRWYAVWLRTDEATPRVGTLLVPAGLPGTRIVDTWDHLGLRASGSHDVVFDDVLVDLDNAIDLREPQDWGGADAGLQADMAVLLGALYTGVARAARRCVRCSISGTRTNPIRTLPHIRTAWSRSRPSSRGLRAG